MDAALKERWVTALRSGEYQQGTGELHILFSNTFCCLGVLCAISGAGNFSGRMFEFADGDVINDSLELKGRNFFGVPHPIEAALIKMNDGDQEYKNDQRSFTQIADYIEANL